MGTPTDIVDLATACVASVNATVGVELDFSADTLPLLDHYAKQVLDSPEEEIIDLVAPMCGAYFGEVVRRRFEGARWHAPKEEHAEWRIEFEHAFLYFNPVGVALDIVLEGDGPLPSHLQVKQADKELVEHALSVYGDVRESDYYSFSVRLEVIEQVLAALARQSEEPEQFKSSDYKNFVAGQQKN